MYRLLTYKESKLPETNTSFLEVLFTSFQYRMPSGRAKQYQQKLKILIRCRK